MWTCRKLIGFFVLLYKTMDAEIVTIFVIPKIKGAGVMEIPNTRSVDCSAPFLGFNAVIPVVPTAPIPSFPLHSEVCVRMNTESLEEEFESDD